MSEILGYFREMAVFMIFSGIAGMLSPDKYKKYVTFCAGFIIIIAALKPVAALLSLRPDDYANVVFEDVAKGYGAGDDAAAEKIIAAYKAELYALLAKELNDRAGETGYVMARAEFAVEEDYGAANFGELYNASVWLKKEKERRGFIYVEKIEVEPFYPSKGANAPANANEDNYLIKKIISDFYNLSNENINVFIGAD